MTFTLEIRAAHLREIALELTEPTLPLSDLDRAARDRLPPEVAANWRGIQVLVAESIVMRRPVVIEPEISHYLTAVIRQRSYQWHTLSHGVADGERFRSGLTDNVGGALGIPLAANLVRRPIACLVADAHPYFGWATNQELRETLSSVDPARMPPREQRTADLHGFVLCIQAAVDRGYDLVSIYDGSIGAEPAKPAELVGRS